MEKRKIVFIQPGINYELQTSPPLGLLRLASITPDDFDVEIIDGSIEIIVEKKVDIAVITVQTLFRNEAYEIADNYKKKGAKVFLGGIHPSIIPSEAIQHADSVVIGEAEEVWPKTLEDLDKGKLKKFYYGGRPDLKELPLINWDLVKGNKYFYKYSIQTGRGCPYGCDFCSVDMYNGQKARHAPIKDVLREVQNIIEHKGSHDVEIFVVDDNIMIDKEYVKELFNALITLKIKWISQCSINIADDPGLLDLMAKSGCKSLYICFDSIIQ